MSIMRVLPVLCFSAASVTLTGCMLSPTASPTAEPAVITGTVHGGQSPVTGSRIFLFEATAGGYGQLSKSDVLPASGTLDTTYNAYYVTTDATGSFGLTGKYTCTPGAQVYLLATQGNPGLSAGSNNPALAEMGALGACPNAGVLSPTLNVMISEATTVASVYALAGYMTAPNAVSRANTALAQTGLANAFATVNNLVSPNGYALGMTPASGTIQTFGTTGYIPAAKINLLANILAACINSDGTSGGACTTLFTNATSDGTSTGAVPTDTATAILNIAHNPAANVGNLYKLASASGPFQPMTATQPNDMTLAIGYTITVAGGLAQPTLQSISIDALGNMVIPLTTGGTAFTGALTNAGTALSSDYSTRNGSVPIQYAIDQQGNAWTAFGTLNTGVGTLVRYTVASGAKVTYGETQMLPTQIAIDSLNHVYVADPASGKVVSYNTDGSIDSTAGESGVYPHIAVDTSRNMITLGAQTNAIYLNKNAFTGGGLNQPGSLAIDSSGAVWTANANSSNSLSRFSISGTGAGATATAISPAAGYSGGGLTSSANSNYAPVVMDGGSNAWYANYDKGTVSLISNSGVAVSPSTGYVLADHPEGLAVDGSGNVWVTVNTGFGASPVLYEMVGAAVPLATPILPGQFGVRP